MKTLNIKIKLPVLVSVRDYHEFEMLQDTLRTLSDSIVKVKELSFLSLTEEEQEEFSRYDYLGVVYVGKRPIDKEIKKFEVIEI